MEQKPMPDKPHQPQMQKEKLFDAEPVKSGPASQGQLPQKKGSFTKIALAVGAAVIALAVGSGIFFSQPTVTPDQPTQAQITQMENSWAAALESGGLLLPTVQPEERAEALASMQLSEKEKTAIIAEVEAGRADLVWITLWDNLVEDGDIVTLYSDGLTIKVPLLKAPQRVALPRPAGGVVNLIGTVDGGGGITLGLMSGANQVLIPPLVVGQKVGLPVR